MPIRVTPTGKPADVPSMAEFNELKAQVETLDTAVEDLDTEMENLTDRVTALEGEEPEPPDPPDPPASGSLVCTIVLNGTRTEFNEEDATDLGDFADPRGRFIMSCKRLIQPQCPVIVDFRHAGEWSCIIFAFGDPFDTTGADLPAYSVEFPADMRARFKLERRRGRTHRRLTEISVRLSETIEVPKHFKFARWRWQSCEWPFPLTTIEELEAEHLLPRMDAAVACGTARSYGPVTYEPMGLAGIYSQMGAGGQRPDIGFVTDWQADYICTQSQTALDNVLAQGEAAGTIPWFIMDPNTVAIIDPTSADWKSASSYGTSGNPRLYKSVGSGIQIDSAHEPAVSYLPFALTGDPYYLESLQAQVVYFITSCPGGWYNQGNGIWKPLGMGQTRGVAWMTRDIMQAVRMTPEDAPPWLLPKSKMREIFQASIDGLKGIQAATEPLRSVFHAVAGSRGDYDNTGPGGTIPSGCWYATWQEDFVQCVLAWGAMMHPDIPELLEFCRWHVVGLIDRAAVEPSGWCGGWPELYWKAFQDTRDGPQYPDWGKAWERNSVVQGLPEQTLAQLLVSPSAFDYPNNLQAGLSMAVQAGINEAQPALDMFATTLEDALRAGKGFKEYKWCVAR